LAYSSSDRRKHEREIFPTIGKSVLKNLRQLIDAWGRRSLGAIIRDWWNTPAPNPWSDEDQEAVSQPEAVRICHRCLTPQEHVGWFCPECGAATGPYNNFMPFVNVFSTGEVLRAGTDGKTKFARWVYPVYFVVGLFEYFLFAPFYWYRLFRAQKRRIQNLKGVDDDNSI
jgi:hypothetical protein